MISRRVSQPRLRRLRALVGASRIGHIRRIWLVALAAVLATVGIGSVSARFDISSTPVTTVSAASFEGVAVATDSIVAAFGQQLASSTIVASDADPSTPGIQLPAQLGGTTVEVNGRRAGLFFVSPTQINYAVPSATEAGPANVVIKSDTGTISNGTMQVTQVVPSVFTANADGKGVPAATVVRLKSNGLQFYEALSKFNPVDNRLVTKAIDLGPQGERIYLILFVTGVRRATVENVRLLIGGEEIAPVFVGPQPDFVGLDQINAEIPRSLLGRGIVKVSVAVNGFTASNLVDIEIAGTAGSAPPQVMSFGSTSALAGQELVINGSGFSPNKVDNLVRIAGLDVDEIMTATSTQLKVMVPFGVETGTVSVRTALGEGVSANILPVRTSISGYVENTSRQPLIGVQVKLVHPTLNISENTTADGSFVLPDVPVGSQFVEVDGGTVGSNPPFPKITLKIAAHDRRDNQFSRAIALQQSTGSGGTVGGGGGSGLMTGGGADTSQAVPNAAPITIKTGDYSLEIADGTKANFPGGATFGSIVLTPLKEARTPVDLPLGYFSSAIVQITPFNVALDPGAKLVLPNTDGFPAGAPALLFRYDSKEGKFVQDSVKANVTQNGRFIETEPGAIKSTTFYFAAVLRNTTTISGRIVEKNGVTPVIRASVNFRGQETATDGNGSYVLRFVPVREGERISVEAGILRSSGRVDRATSTAVPVVIGGTTKIPPIFMPGFENRKPTILVQQKIEIDEGKNADIPVIVSDPDANQTVRVSIDAPNFVSLIRTLSPNAAATYALRLNPGFTHAGSYKVTISALDNLGAAAIDDIDLVVRNVNRVPLAKELAFTLDEDAMVNIKLDGSDPDNDPVKYAVVTQPASGTLSGDVPNLVYKPNLNFNGLDRFSYKVNDGQTDGNTALVVITVKPVNDPPVLSVPGAQMVDEGNPLSFAVSASDVDGATGLTLTAASLPTGATFTPVVGNGAQFQWTPTFQQAGVYTVTFKVTDNGNPPLSETKTVTITVMDVNRPPALSVPGAQMVDEGKALSFAVSASDADGAEGLTLTAASLPAGATFTPGANNSALFQWTPTLQQAGVYIVTFKVMDNGNPPLSDTKPVTITVKDVNRPPALSVPGAQMVDEGKALSFAVSASDADGAEGLTLTAASLPAGATFTPGANNTAQFQWTPTFQQAGVYNVSFIVTDNGNPPLSDTKPVTITVKDVNRAPVLSVPGAQMVDEGKPLSFAVSASDADGATGLTLTATGLPAGATFTPGAGNGAFQWTPTLLQSGVYNVSFIVTDNGNPALSDTKPVTITVKDVNRAPVLSVPGAQMVDEGKPLSFAVSASDADGAAGLTLTATGLPTGATFTPVAGNGAFQWTPTLLQAGVYTVTFTVTDNGTPPLNDTKTVTITVKDVPATPPPQTKSVNDGVK